MPPALDHIDSWIFDLDNTLYAPSAKLFDLIDARMGAFIMRLLNVDAVEARRVQKQYFHDHGTTMAGLRSEERRVGKECGSTCVSRWVRVHEKKHKKAKQ